MQAQYIEVEEITKAQFTALLNLVERDRAESEKAKTEQLVIEAKRMLKAWGAVNSYSSRCGYKNISSMFSALYPRCDKIIIENEIEFIEQSLLELKKSSDKKKNQQYLIAELYYKGFDIVDCGCDWSERISADMIGQDLGLSERTVYRRLNSLNSFIVSRASNINFLI